MITFNWMLRNSRKLNSIAGQPTMWAAILRDAKFMGLTGPFVPLRAHIA
jgi:hypothetical protein